MQEKKVMERYNQGLFCLPIRLQQLLIVALQPQNFIMIQVFSVF